MSITPAPRLCRPALGLTALLVGVAGCHTIDSSAGVSPESILKAARPSDEAVTLDIYWVRLPHAADDPAEAELWSDIQEDRAPVEVRRRLARNGLRVGAVGAAMPDSLLRLVNPEGVVDTSDATSTALSDTGVRRKTKRLRLGQEIELNASEAIAETPLLLPHGDWLRGETFDKVQGVYVAEATRQGDQGIRLKLSPRVRHGEPRVEFDHDETGVISRQTLRQEMRSFPQLEVAAPLASGEMLLVTNLPRSGSRLGWLFHQATGERRAMLIRVAAAPPTRAFLPER